MKQTYKWLPVIKKENCTGCGLCVEACTPKCLEVVDGVVVLTLPILCGSEEHCISPCNYEAIEMKWVPAPGRDYIGLWHEK
ncbi:MAG: 4Fe-4S binding protein [Candidatus Omnitrophica bacterium]|nr:4Fe-4S binding protein [Candidatus Omnitrophota bacterium]